MKHFAKIQTEFLKLCDDLSGEVHKEHEKRIKLKELPKECEDIKPILIKQGIIKEVKNGDDVISYVRIRLKQEPEKDPEYSLGVKHFPLHQEAETEISKDIFDAFYPDNLLKPQVKHRYTLDNGWEVDKIDDGSFVAEYEHDKSQSPINIPKHWIVKEE